MKSKEYIRKNLIVDEYDGETLTNDKASKVVVEYVYESDVETLTHDNNYINATEQNRPKNNNNNYDLLKNRIL